MLHSLCFVGQIILFNAYELHLFRVYNFGILREILVEIYVSFT
jgi:hypothetical protein